MTSLKTSKCYPSFTPHSSRKHKILFSSAEKEEGKSFMLFVFQGLRCTQFTHLEKRNEKWKRPICQNVLIHHAAFVWFCIWSFNHVWVAIEERGSVYKIKQFDPSWWPHLPASAFVSIHPITNHLHRCQTEICSWKLAPERFSVCRERWRKNELIAIPSALWKNWCSMTAWSYSVNSVSCRNECNHGGFFHVLLQTEKEDFMCLTNLSVT